VAAQLTPMPRRPAEVGVRNPSGQSNPVTIHARKTGAKFAPLTVCRHVFRRHQDALRLEAPDSHTIRVDQSYSDFRKGEKAKLDSLAYLPLQDFEVIDLIRRRRSRLRVIPWKLGEPIVTRSRARISGSTGTLKDPAYTVRNSDLVFERTLHGLRNTVLLPAGWEVSAVSQSGTIGMYQGRAFVSLINLNAESV